jgi:hypothetical protein
VLLARTHDREHDLVTNTGRDRDLFDAVTGLEESADLGPPLSLRPLPTLGDPPQRLEFVVRHRRLADRRRLGVRTYVRDLGRPSRRTTPTRQTDAARTVDLHAIAR